MRLTLPVGRTLASPMPKVLRKIESLPKVDKREIKQSLNKGFYITAGKLLKSQINKFEAKFLGPADMLPNSLERLPEQFNSLRNKIQEVDIKTKDGITLKCWDIPPKGDNPYIIHCHGAKGSLISNAPRIKAFSDLGFGVLGLEYRGYAGHSGLLSEKGLSDDADAAYKYLKDKGVKKIGITGHSMGGAVALGLAKRQPAAFLVLESTIKSTLDVAKELLSRPNLPTIPGRLNVSTKVPNFFKKFLLNAPAKSLPLNNPNRNIDKIVNLGCETKIVASKEDKLVSFNNSVDLAKLKGDGVQLDIVDTGDHYSFDSKKDIIISFLEKMKSV